MGEPIVIIWTLEKEGKRDALERNGRKESD